MSEVLKHVPNRRKSSRSNTNCCVYGCNAVKKKNPELSFHKFPHRGEKLKQINTYGEVIFVDRRNLWELNLKCGKSAKPDASLFTALY
ncbi:hypothetical protein TcasGA2_TC001820 [Tribolium castaneum]|uniref:Uncharacterized protein n=1 Tax=Tribolium castaneum TaxID=7070 RepID=D7EJ66_TRICA|nr:hypothetical protein TcasGA2_TC001820 [Tribolium castaneum]